MQLSQQQEAARAEFRSFVERDIVPHADDFDRHQRLPTHVIRTLAERGYLGPSIPVEFGGLGWDLVLSGLFYEELGRACSSVRSLVTVNCMTAHAILRWGSQAQKQQWLPRIASGEIICGFALSEPTAGSDASTVETTAAPKDGAYVLNGTKKWITFGQIAGLFLVVSRCDGHHAAFLVDGNSPGLTREDITGLLGVRASMLAAIHLNGCTVGRDRMLGNLGFGFAPVATTAIEYGR
ncbi:MAG TPA: acyl-CoA dehydrogenase family protein, partial [Blastocatellia bacterium]|nr:acyl-CoA dehydrogenase family protein [Blastocatellia bacterium]